MNPLSILFNHKAPFNVFEVLQFCARDFVSKPHPDAAEINRRFRRIALTLHPDKCKVPSKYTFQQLAFARDALTMTIWREHQIRHAIRLFRHEDPPEPQRPQPRTNDQHTDASNVGNTDSGMPSGEPSEPVESPSSNPVRDCSPVCGVAERHRRPYSVIDLTRCASPTPTGSSTARKRGADEADLPNKRQKTPQQVNVRIIKILLRPKSREVEEYTWKRSHYSRAWCWVKSSEPNRIEVDRDSLLLYASRLSVTVQVNADWFTVVVELDRARRVFKGRDPIEGKRVEIEYGVMGDMMGDNNGDHVGYMY